MTDAKRMARDAAWTIPTEILRAELARRDPSDDAAEDTRPACGSGHREEYKTGLHVGALVLILVISTLACGFPLFKRRTSKGMRPSKIIFYCQHFGTGVLIATAFVHLLPTAFISLTDPCLPHFFNEGYNPLAGLIAMIFALSVVWLESYLTTRGAGHSHSHMWDEDDAEASDGNSQHKCTAHGSHGEVNGMSSRRGQSHRPESITLGDRGASEGLMAGVSPLPESSPTHKDRKNSNNNSAKELSNGNGSRDDDDDDNDDDESAGLTLRLDELSPISSNSPNSPTRPSITGEPDAPHLPDSAEQKRLMLQCLLLEAGILFHSVFIGMAISVATGPAFMVFLVAIAFHQCFEGLALGSRIAAIHFPRSSYRPWLMVLAYGTTTPLGQAIGLVVHNLYDPMSQTGLLMVGIMNAISSGLLLFAGLVQLLAEDFLTEKSYKTLRGKRRNQAFLAVVSGATLMAIVGAFA